MLGLVFLLPAYWASHIKNIRYNIPATKPYSDLFDSIKDKNYFIITTNVDGQFEKAGFSKDIIFAPQGDYGLFQCEKPCCDEVFDNKDMIDKMVSNIDYESFIIRSEDIPICHKCGGYMSRNLRVDNTFVETPHLLKQKDYVKFINNSSKEKLVLIELGVGFNTPSIIRWPFDGITAKYPNTSLIRVNMDYPEIPKEIISKGLSFDNDISKVISDIRSAKVW